MLVDIELKENRKDKRVDAVNNFMY